MEKWEALLVSKFYFKFDGGFIMVPWDRFEEAVDWYREHMGWKLKGTADTPVGRKAFFRMPGAGQANLKSFEMDIDHFTMEGYAEGNNRFCFRVANLEQTLTYFQRIGVECSVPVQLPDGTFAADMKAFGGVRLTLSEDRKLEGKYPESRVIRYGAKPLWLGVSDLKASVEWYENILGLVQAKKDYKDRGFALMRDDKDKWDSVWMEQVSSNSSPVKTNPGARLYFVVKGRDNFRDAHKWLKDQGVETSNIVGERWTGFHFFDPDGNRLNVWTY
jgi:catechol 2,3-dioxygenase-like lactoylglutathione lyase family enzyme